MPELSTSFQPLPEDYQHVIHLAQEKHGITIAPLQLLVGGWSGAVVYLVSVSSDDGGQVEHCVLKLDHKGKAKTDEVTRHTTVMSQSTPAFARDHIAELAYKQVEHEGAMAIFYRIAGQSLINYRPLSGYERQSQLETIFQATNTILLAEWNENLTFEQAVHPQKVLENWLGFRLEPGRPTEAFIRSVCQADPDAPGFLINGEVFPNPLLHARQAEGWGKARPIDIARGFIHGDLNTNNILVKFGDDGETLEGYYLIDFALFKAQMPLLYDQRYLEMSYLIHTMRHVSFAKCIDLITRLAEADAPDPNDAPIEMAGATTVIAAGRSAFAAWAEANHPSLHDDLWAQYWLAGAAVGLSYCHKAGLPDENRLAGLIYAAANMKRFGALFPLPAPAEVVRLYDEDRFTAPTQGGTLSAAPAAPRHNLPAQLTPFIGRERQIAAVEEMLVNPDVRLVTLIGPGGTGKTRLSLQVAESALDEFPQGVWFVPLADDADTDQLVSRIAQGLEVREGGRPLLENVKDFLCDKNLLLVLDNFEQLASSAPVVSDLLAGAPGVKALVSSRVALNVQGEREFPVPPMELPQAGDGLSTKDLAENESVRLFTERAQAARPDFSLTDENAEAVAQICRRLDGLPLALELAAARIKLLSPQAILARLDDRLKLLTGGARDLPARQQTLRNTLEWSYDLLNEDEQTLYARLGVFVGGFSLEAAEAVCNPDGGLDILDGVAALVDHSLLRQEEGNDGETRFGMLETIRAYALERLAARGEMEAMQAQHAGYFGGVIVEQAGFGLYSPKALTWLNWLERELDNVRATLAWCLSTPQGVELAAGLVFSLIWFWYRRGYFIEGWLWTERVLNLPAMQAPSPPRATALSTSGLLALWKGEQKTALARMQESLEVELRGEDEFMVPAMLMGNGIAYINMGRDSDARPFLEQARAGFKAMGQAYFQVFTIVHLGNAELGLGNADQARALHEEALGEAQAIGEDWLVSFALNNLGEVARTQGKYEMARGYYEQCEALLRDTGDRGDFARFEHSLGYIAQHEGDYTQAERQFRESLAMFRQLGNRRGMAECMAGLAGLKARQGEAEWGAAMLGAADTLLKVTGGAWWPADRVEMERTEAILREALDEAALAAAREKGETMTLEEALAFASEIP